jgi:hypothetical protein
MIMAKNKSETPADATNEAAAAEAPAKGGRAITYTLTEEHASKVGKNAGDTMTRQEYIKARADAGAPRGEIKKEISALEGKDIPFQVVFGATKDHPNYPKRAPKAASTEAAPADAQS